MKSESKFTGVGSDHLIVKSTIEHVRVCSELAKAKDQLAALTAERDRLRVESCRCL